MPGSSRSQAESGRVKSSGFAVERWREPRPDGAVIHAGRGDGNDLTLCGYALEGEGGEDGSDEACAPVSRGKIDCPHCLVMIRHCKAIPSRFLARGEGRS